MELTTLYKQYRAAKMAAESGGKRRGQTQESPQESNGRSRG